MENAEWQVAFEPLELAVAGQSQPTYRGLFIIAAVLASRGGRLRLDSGAGGARIEIDLPLDPAAPS